MGYIGTSPASGDYTKLDDISSGFNGSETTFALQVAGVDATPPKATAVIISVGGVLQEPVSAYDISVTSIVFTAAPAAGADFFGVILGIGVDIGTPGDGTVTSAKIADDAVTLAKMAAGTEGNIISFDANGDPVAVATGTDGQILTSAGAGAAPAFEDAYSDSDAISAVENEATLALAGDVSVAADKAISLANEGKVKFTDTTFGDGDQRSSGVTLRFTTDGLAVAIGQAVHLSGTGVILADADVASQGAIPCIGVAASATTGTGTENIDVLVLGCMRYDTYDFTAGSDVFVTATPGGLDETAPSTTGHYVQKVGIAMSADILYVNPSLDVIEHA